MVFRLRVYLSIYQYIKFSFHVKWNTNSAHKMFQRRNIGSKILTVTAPATWTDYTALQLRRQYFSLYI
jgi:hypothetical protein